MSRVRVYELARELGFQVGDVVERCRSIGIDVDAASGHLTQLSEEEAVQVRQALAEMPKASITEKRVGKTVIRRRRKVRKVVATPTPDAAAAEDEVEEAPRPVRRRARAASAEEPPAEVAAEAAESAPAEATPEPDLPAEAASAEEPAEAAAEAVQPAEEAPTVEPEAPVQEAAPEPPAEIAAEAEESPETTPSEPAPEAEVPVEQKDEERPTEKSEEGDTAAEGGDEDDEEAARTDTQYGSLKAVNAPGVRQPEERRRFAQVVGQLDDDMRQQIVTEAQRRAQRVPGRGPRPAGPPPRGGGAPRTGPGLPEFMPGPFPPSDRDGDRRRKRRSGSRVAYDRVKDSFGGKMRMRPKRGVKRRRTGASTEITTPKASKRVIKMEETITVAELATQLAVKAPEVIKVLMNMGEMVTVNHVLDLDTVTLVAQEFDFTVENVAFDIENYIPKVDEEEKKSKPRDPIITVMGHVDHGKTSLLDFIRKSRVAAGEAGGITQHIGAYKVPVKIGKEKKSLVFLDTPGHAAFTAMRARGAEVTDVVILVVAADDGVMPQTIEAIAHSKAAGVPIVVAVNKCDREDADPDRVRTQLTEHELIPEEWGGETQVINISAKSGDGIPELLEAVSLQADMLELAAVVDRPAMGVVLEAELSRGRGSVATVLVQEGTLSKGDIVVAGKASGRVRALVDDRGRQIKKAGPSTPVEILGMNEVPEASETFFVVKDERDAKHIVSHIEDKDREKRLAEERKKVSLEDLFEQMQEGETQTLALIIKADVQGSLEALRHTFSQLKHPELEIRVLHGAAGAIKESDVDLASASNAIIIGFNVRPEKKAKQLAEQTGIDIKLYSVIYEAVDDVKAAMEGMLAPKIKENFLGKASVRDTFHIPKHGVVAGCAVLQGKMVRNQNARLVRDSIVVYEGKLDSLRRFKEAVNEVDRGHECGVHLENYNDVKIGDEIECYELVEVAQKLELASQ